MLPFEGGKQKMNNEHLYSEVPYDFQCFAQTQPTRLALWAGWKGLAAPHPDQCRVLEVGAGRGMNLVPVLEEHPGARALALDLHAPSIGECRRDAAWLGLEDRLQAEVHDIAGDAGRFGEHDYVIAHGLYGWIPPEARPAMLRAFRQWLAPNGVGYINFNSRPGSVLRGEARELLLRMTADAPDHAERVRRAREIARQLEPATPAANPAAMALKETWQRVIHSSDSILAHDLLGAHSDAIAFRSFHEEARQAGLRVLGATFDDDGRHRLPPAAHGVLARLAAHPASEGEMVDLLAGTAYREVLVMRDDAPVGEPRWEGWLAAPVRFLKEDGSLLTTIDPRRRERVIFTAFGGMQASADRDLLKAALLELSCRWPEAVPLDDLCRSAAARLGRPDAGQEALPLKQALKELHRLRLVDWRVTDPRVAREIPDRPRVASSVRLQARQGAKVWNRHHIPVILPSPAAAWLLHHCDGTRDLPALLEAGARSAVAMGLPWAKDDATAERELAAAWKQLQPLLVSHALLTREP